MQIPKKIVIATDQNKKKHFRKSLIDACQAVGINTQTARNHMSRNQTNVYQSGGVKVQVIREGELGYYRALASYLETKNKANE